MRGEERTNLESRRHLFELFVKHFFDSLTHQSNCVIRSIKSKAIMEYEPDVRDESVCAEVTGI